MKINLNQYNSFIASFYFLINFNTFFKPKICFANYIIIYIYIKLLYLIKY